MTELIVIFLVVISVFFMVGEIFLFPGLTVCGLISLAAGAAALWFAYAKMGLTAGLITTIVWLIFLGVAIWLFVRSRALDKMSLKAELHHTQKHNDATRVAVGAEGVTVSRLAPMGMVRIEGEEYEARSVDGLIGPKRHIEVVDHQDNHLIVRIKEIESL